MTKAFGHWTSSVDLDPDNAFGFIYRITNMDSGQMYIGKKQYYLYKKSKKLKPNNWKTYTGSSKDLNSDIKKLGKAKFSFEILHECRTRGWLTYMECNYQHKEDVLTTYNDDDLKMYYNKQIGAVRYVPKRIDDPTPIKRTKK